MQALASVFISASKLSLRILAEDGCVFHEMKMHSVIYRVGQLPEFCYILSHFKSVRALWHVLHSDINELKIYICHQSLIAISIIIKVQVYLFDS